MNLEKVNYVDGETIIKAKNLNDIQDAIIRTPEFKQGDKIFIDNLPIIDGQIIFNTETGEIFQDVGNKRISIGGAVDSVNGRTGTVELGAADLGAIPNEYAPTEAFKNVHNTYIFENGGRLYARGTDTIEYQGTSGIWHYIKYKSGLAICWGTGEPIICGATVAWGKGWETDDSAPSTAFPFKFTDVYINLGELSCIGGHMLTVRIAEGQSVSTIPQTTSTLFGYRPTSTAKITLLPYYLVVGRWK